MVPKISLAIDNCFASKRWTSPNEWMDIVRDLDLRYVEASADTECDPLYTTKEYLRDWAAEVRENSERTGVRVSQLFSGHGSYATLGLAHTDARVRRHMLENWLYPMCELSGSLGARLGFYCHAFPISVLQDPKRYEDMRSELCSTLALAADKAYDSGCRAVSVEQMYSPHQVPWTLADTEDLLRNVNRLAKHPLHVTIDVGHQTGQARYLLPQGSNPGSADAQKRPYLYARPEDGDTGRWLERFGRYAPCIHLQQTDGKTSRHLPFTPECNAAGVVRGDGVLSAIGRSYEREPEPGMPPGADEIFLTLEIFAETAGKPDDILTMLRQSVAYWRRFIPRDGTPLDRLLS